MADWDSKGYMKLVYGNKNRKGASYFIDNFMVGHPSNRPKGVVVALGDHLATDVLALDATSDSKAGKAKPAAGASPVKVDEKLSGEGGLLVEDFKKYSPTTGLGGDFGTFHKPDFQGKFTTRIVRDEERGTALQVSYTLPNKDDFAGIYRMLTNFDLKPYKSLSFWVKGLEPHQIVWVGLKTQDGQENKVLIGPFLEEGITRKWQKIVLPLSAFTDIKEFARPHSLTIQFVAQEANQQGGVVIDDIRFEKDVAPLFISNCGQPWESQTIATGAVEKTPSGAVSVDAGTNIWGGGNFVFRTSKAQIIGTNDIYGCFIHFSGIRSSDEDESWAGWGGNLDNLDVSQYGTLAFKVKRVNSDEHPNVYLADDKNRHYVYLDTYVQPSMDWQTVEIPLSKFEGVNLHSLKSISLGFEWETMSGALYIRDIAFKAAPPVAPAEAGKKLQQ